MNKLYSIGVMVVALAAGCGGSKKEETGPAGKEVSCDAAAGKIFDFAKEQALEGASEEQVAQAEGRATTAFTDACNEGAWSAELRGCFFGATSPEDIRDCSDKFDDAQKEVFMTKMGEAFDMAGADAGGGGGDDEDPTGDEDEGGETDDASM